MSELFSSLGIEWKILLAQVINFAILALVFKLFLFKPIIKVLEDRKRKLEDDRKKSEELGSSIKKASDKEKEILDKARSESEKIIKNAEALASKLREDLLKEARLEADRVMKKGEEELQGISKKAEDEILKRAGSLIALAIEKSIGDVADQKIKKNLEDQAISYLEKLDKNRVKTT